MVFWYLYNAYGILDLIWMINYRNKQNYRFRTWKFRDRCHLKGGVRQGCFQSLILNNLIQYIHFHSLYITSHYYAKFKENPCVGTDARPPFIYFGYAKIHDFLGVSRRCWVQAYVSWKLKVSSPSPGFDPSVQSTCLPLMPERASGSFIEIDS